VLPLEVASPRSIAELAREVETLGLHIDLLVNNAGVLPAGERFGALEAKDLAETFATNVQGPLLLTQALADRLVDGGKVVAIGSGLGSIARADAFGTPSYAISKAALNMAMRQLGHALAARRIAVIALSPGWVKTDMGGAGANLEPSASIAMMLAVIDRTSFDAAHIGAFLAHDGTLMPW
jgi:NAD(P)-dependent dehydrogenase (short-subunit alcohol dehydrogenase family)